MDNHGNWYEESEIMLPVDTTSSGQLLASACGCDEFDDQEVPFQSENYFNLSFKDCLESTQNGFDDPLLGRERRRVACKAYAYLARLISQEENPCSPGSPPKVNIEVSSFFDSGTPSNPAPLGTGTAIIMPSSPLKFSDGGILDAQASRVIQNPCSLGSTLNLAHARVGVNFHYTFFLGDDVSEIGAKYDLYTVVLHEALHGLGFISLMSVLSGDPHINGAKSYSRWDTHLELEGGTPVVVRDSDDPYRWLLNPLVALSDLHRSCVTTPGPQMGFASFSGANFPVYTGDSGLSSNDPLYPAQGTSFQHLNPACPNATVPYLMAPVLLPGERRPLGGAEERILCDLGYKLPDLADCSCSVAGCNDFMASCSGSPFVFSLCSDNESFLIDVQDLIGNDVGADGIAFPKLSRMDGVPINESDHWVDNGDGTFTLSSCGPGAYELQYTPVSSSCPQEGSPVYALFLLERCNDCTFLDGSSLPSLNDCNLICNPQVVAEMCDRITPAPGLVSNINCSPDLDLPGWQSATGTPDISFEKSVSSGSGSIQVFAGRDNNTTNESVYTLIDAVPGAYYLSIHSRPAQSNDFPHKLELYFVGQGIISQFVTCDARAGVSFPDIDLQQGSYAEFILESLPSLAGSNDEFRRRAKCIELPAQSNYEALWIHPKIHIPVGQPNQNKAIFLDNIELVPDDFDLGGDVSSTGCGLSLGGAFCMLSDVLVNYKWYELAGSGSATLIGEYEVINGQATVLSGDIDPLTHQITVAPNTTTTYVLQRSAPSSNSLPAYFELCKDHDQITVSVSPFVPPVLNLASQDCGAVTFSIDGLEGGQTWELDYGDGAQGTSLAHTYTAAGNYQAVLSGTDVCGNIFTSTLTVAVQEVLPDPTFTYTEEDCSFSFSSLGGTASTSHQWLFGTTGLTSTAPNPSGINLPNGVHQVSHTVSNSCGSAEAVLEILVENCCAPLSPGLSATEDCGTATFAFSDLPPGEVPVIDYGDGTQGTALVHLYAASGMYTATATVSDGCDGEVSLSVEVEALACFTCSDCPGGTIGSTGQTTVLSDLVASGALPAAGTGQSLCLAGQLSIDQDYTFSGTLYMAPDAGLIIEGAATLDLNGAHLKGCDYLWHSIEVKQPHPDNEPGLVCRNGTIIEDAKLGIDAAGKAILDITGTTFANNYIGMYLWGISLSGFHGNTFHGADGLKPSLSPAPNIGEQSFAGIYSDRGSLHIGVAGAAANRFEEMSNGILNTQGQIMVENSAFEGMAQNASAPYPVTGFGIWHKGLGRFGLTQRGFGDGPAAEASFTDCHTAIWSEGANTKVHFNSMQGVNTGVHVSLGVGNTIEVDHNNIACNELGIVLAQNAPAASITVWNNEVHVGQNALQGSYGAGISVEEQGALQPQALIEQNDIYLYQRQMGVRLNSAAGYTVRENDIYLQSPTVIQAWGIRLENSLLCQVSCNTAQGMGRGQGLSSESTAATRFSCNDVENLEIGISVGGASSGTFLETNTLLPPFSRGLLYHNNIAMMPPQIQAGNIWEDGTYSDAAAVHLGSGDFFYFFGQRFDVHTTAPPYYPPSISLPNSGGVPPTAWFSLEQGSPMVCNEQTLCPLIGFVPTDEEEKGREAKLAQGEYAGEWPGGLHWAAMQQLYGLLERSPGIKDTSALLSAYHQAMQAGALGQLLTVRQGADSLHLRWPAQVALLQGYAQEMEALLLQVAEADSILAQQPGAVLPQSPQQLLAKCSNLASLADTLASQLDSLRAIEASSLLALNSGVIDTALYLSNEKAVNALYLAALLGGSGALDSAQAAVLFTIAQQCPDEGGPAVYCARSLYRLCGTADFDAAPCQAIAPLLGQHGQRALPQPMAKAAGFRVFPNPNSGRFALEYELEADGQLLLTDLMGRSLAPIPLPAGEQRMEAMPEGIRPGLYLLRIVSASGALLHSEKVIIIR